MQRFGEFMQEWLYGEGGYYRSLRIGKEGDFYTSVSVSEFFGYTLAYYLQQQLNLLPNQKIAIIEIGAERGNLISDIAFFLQENYKDFKKIDFLILEPLKPLHNIQKQNFLQKIDSKEPFIVEDFQAIKSLHYDFIFYCSNELLDAFPCELYHQEQMAFIENDTLRFQKAPAPIEQIARKFNLQISEIPLGVEEFIKNCDDCAKNWMFLTFDYGSLESRNEFSLRFFEKHTTKNLFISPKSTEYDKSFLESFGQYDITYDVNFAIWNSHFQSIGAKKLFCHRQNRALVDMGLDKVGEWYIAKYGLESFMKNSSKIRTLIEPGLLGERFFGMAFVK
ncbi:SAM-dependent methyltransferase [Helicobacter mesocricetorum]|uniref:SAM-dependent methyltransferase n=1 Tax=Helicobacter mesocricetorum TaxID=87012 RepID=UPI0013151B00|nr:SAM-dependent methyltransferase [Helicobacter mesocricetorum]